MIDIILFGLGLAGLLIGSFTDLQRREVPDYINYGLITAGLGVRIAYALTSGDWLQLAFAAVGTLVCFGIACLFFYTGQWGGGDAKMLIGLGALFTVFNPFGTARIAPPDFVFAALPLETVQVAIDYHLFFLPYLIINILLAGAVYGLLWSLSLAFIHRRRWWASFKSQARTKRMKGLAILTALCIGALVILAFTMEERLIRFLLLGLCAVALLGFFLQLAIAAVERSCMIREMRVEDLTEGEWINEVVRVDGKYICGPKDLGVTDEQIKRLKRLGVRTVVVKIGIPFIPAFLAGFIMTCVWGNLFAFFV